MKLRIIILGGLAVVAFSFLVMGAWFLSVPEPPQAQPLPTISTDETQRYLDALKPPKRRRPVVAVVGINDATEVTDYLVPMGILRRAGVADVHALSTGPGPVRLYPALQVMPDTTLGEFDSNQPAGADYVIVPAMSRDDDPAVMAWLQDQARKGAIIIGVCAGAKVVAAAGLLDGKRATTHWYYLKELRRKHPTLRYVADRRFVVDGRMATTTGITASIPMVLTLIEAIAGRAKAESVASGLGVEHWDAAHSSAAFRFHREFAGTVLANSAAVWERETLGIELKTGVDEVALALVADAWSRTYRSRAITFAADEAPRISRAGLPILPDRVAAHWPTERRLAPFVAPTPVEALDRTLHQIAMRYGTPTADVVAMQLEYPARGWVPGSVERPMGW